MKNGGYGEVIKLLLVTLIKSLPPNTMTQQAQINKTQKLNVGDVFVINTRGYKDNEFTVTQIKDGLVIAQDESGKADVYSFPFEAIEYYGEKVRVVKPAPVETESQSLMLALLDGRAAFEAKYKQIFGESDCLLRAIYKAEEVFRTNKSLKFIDGVLSFTSSDSGRDYIVTRDGCSTNCPAGHGIHYHTFLYDLCAIEAASNVVEIGYTGICDLCGKASRNGGIHTACHQEEEFLSRAA